MNDPVIPRELVRSVAQRTGLTHAAVQQTLAAAIDEVVSNARHGKPTVFRNFGTFSPRQRPEMVRKSPTSDQLFTLPACVVMHFKASKQLELAFEDPQTVNKTTAVGSTGQLPLDL